MRSAILFLCLVACTDGAPANRRFTGVWVSTDPSEGMHRGLEITRLDEPVSGIDLDYTLYLYRIDDPPEPVQSGLFSVDGDEVLYDVRWDVDLLNVGVRFAGTLESLSRNEMVLDGRVWTAADALIPGDTTPPSFGDAWWAVDAGAGLGTGLWIDADGAISAGTSTIGADQVTLVDGDGRNARRVRLPRYQSGQFAGIVGMDGDVGYSEGSETVRAEVVTIPGDAFSSDQQVLETRWTQPFSCSALAVVGERWAGLCATSGGYGLAWLDPEDGAVQRETPLMPSLSGRSLWPLGDDVLLMAQGPSPTPAVHGARGDTGYRLERHAPDGTVRWVVWTPGVLRVEHATELDDGTVLAVITGGSELPGGPTWADGRTVLTAFSPDGQVLWERPLDLESGFYVRVAPTAAGFALAVGAHDLDVGGSVGTLTSERGEVLAVVAYDACGQPFDAALFEDCSEECGGTVTQSPVAGVVGLARDPGGALVVQASLTGRYAFGRDEVGGSDGGYGVVARVAAPPVAAPCDPPAPAPPSLRVEVTGPGEVSVEGAGTCDGTCTFPLPRFAEVNVEGVPDTGFQVQTVGGACDELPCTLHADERTMTLEVTFDEPDAMLVPVDTDIGAVASGGAYAFAAGVLGPSQQVHVDGVLVADGSSAGAWIAALDEEGLAAHVAVPKSPQGPYIRHLAAQPALDVAALLGAGTAGVFVFDAEEATLDTYPTPAGGEWEQVAIDGLGNVAVLGTQTKTLVLASVDGDWTTSLPTHVTPAGGVLVGVPTGGFVVAAKVGGSVEVAPGVTWTGNGGYLALIRFDTSGTVVGGRIVTSGGASSGTQVWSDGVSIFVTASDAQDTSLPYGPTYVERYDLDGVYLDAVGVPTVPLGVWPWSGGFVGASYVHEPVDPWSGGPIDHRGGTDRAVAWFDDDGAYLSAGSMGSSGDDYVGSLVPVAVLPDGSVWLSSPVDAGVSTPYALGRFAPP